jgi:hypothetical protein
MHPHVKRGAKYKAVAINYEKKKLGVYDSQLFGFENVKESVSVRDEAAKDAAWDEEAAE